MDVGLDADLLLRVTGGVLCPIDEADTSRPIVGNSFVEAVYSPFVFWGLSLDLSCVSEDGEVSPLLELGNAMLLKLADKFLSRPILPAVPVPAFPNTTRNTFLKSSSDAGCCRMLQRAKKVFQVHMERLCSRIANVISEAAEAQKMAVLC
jgi:hypothetical protein